ncbi:MAG: DUF1553 domain-containing protein, partial [Verrucomicrobiales bacterium]
MKHAPILILLALASLARAASEPLSYSRDVQPILSDHCFTCHGPDENSRKAGLRLDLREGAIEAAVVPGDPEESELIFRIHAGDEDEIMPPPKFKKPLTDAKKKILERWIEEGAEYEEHWAFLPPIKATLPAGSAKDPVDRFLDAKLAENDLAPSPRADGPTVLRRLHLDLTGIAPTPEELESFDGSVDAVITRLFASPRYGEHLAREWLDVARYADSSGYQYDKQRTMWPWRDWVVEAFSSNMPFDQFTIEQLAGDLLDDPTEQQRLATGFNRNHPITIEGGVIDEEYRVEYVMDRINTVGTAWLGLTLGCARCHDHKYDPISQKEFYQLFAFFNQVPERGLNGFNPQISVVPVFRREALAEIDREIEQQRSSIEVDPESLAAWRASLTPGSWRAGDVITAIRVPAGAPSEVTLTAIPDDPAKRVSGQFVRVSRKGKGIYLQIAELEVMAGDQNIARRGKASQSTTGFGGLPSHAIDGNRSGAWADKTISHTTQQADPWLEVDLGSENEIDSIGLWGRQDCCPERLDSFRVEVLDRDRELVWSLDNNAAPDGDAGRVIEITGAKSRVFTRREGLRKDVRVATGALPAGPGFRIEADSKIESSTADPAWTRLAALPTEVLSKLPDPKSDLADAYRKWSPAAREQQSEIAALEERRKTVFEQSAVSVMVMQDMAEPRDTFVLDRGVYSERRDKVEMGVPEMLPTFGEELPRNRLGFARWLVRPDHPLTARVIVNRVWQRIFGTGLVKSAEDFGIQGERPSHPELLDWLAVDFIESGWDLQHLQRLILTSQAYARSSDYRSDLAEADPENRLLARASRTRMTAEEIRDNTLHSAGVLRDEVGGPPVYPYQPEGLWLEVNNRKGYSRPYPKPEATSLFRRSLYTFAKRTVPHPSLQTFDSPNREFCTVSRSRTNTPL